MMTQNEMQNYRLFGSLLLWPVHGQIGPGTGRNGQEPARNIGNGDKNCARWNWTYKEWAYQRNGEQLFVDSDKWWNWLRSERCDSRSNKSCDRKGSYCPIVQVIASRYLQSKLKSNFDPSRYQFWLYLFVKFWNLSYRKGSSWFGRGNAYGVAEDYSTCGVEQTSCRYKTKVAYYKLARIDERSYRITRFVHFLCLLIDSTSKVSNLHFDSRKRREWAGKGSICQSREQSTPKIQEPWQHTQPRVMFRS